MSAAGFLLSEIALGDLTVRERIEDELQFGSIQSELPSMGKALSARLGFGERLPFLKLQPERLAVQVRWIAQVGKFRNMCERDGAPGRGVVR